MVESYDAGIVPGLADQSGGGADYVSGVKARAPILLPMRNGTSV
jgi:hypothetical protein